MKIHVLTCGYIQVSETVPYGNAIDLKNTAGQAAILLRDGDTFVLLAADAAFSPRNWQEMITPGYGFAREWQRKSLAWIAELAEDPGCAAILCSHDPDTPRWLHEPEGCFEIRQER